MATGVSFNTLQPTILADNGSSAFVPLPPAAPGFVIHHSAPQERSTRSGTPRDIMGEDMEDDSEDLMARGCMLRKLTGVIPEDQAPSSGQPSAPVSWKELELNCQKLDEAEIRITSLDLTCAAEEENTPRYAVYPKSIRYNFEVDSSPASSHAGSSTNGMTPVRTQSSASLSTLATSANSSHLSRSASTESCQNLEKSEPACLKELRKHLAKKGHLASPAGEDECTGASYSVLASAATAATSAVNTSTLPHVPTSTSTKKKAPIAQVNNAGDIVPSKPPQSFGAIRLSSSERTVSCRRGGPTKGQDKETSKHMKNCSFPEDPQAKVTEPRLAHALFEASSGLQRDASMKKPEYSSLVLPGAKARPEARQRGVQGLFQSVKSKCGELFTTQRAGKAATSR